MEGTTTDHGTAIRITCVLLHPSILRRLDAEATSILFNTNMDAWGNSANLNHFDAPLPSYEAMIVESLRNVSGTRGAAPKEIFNYMIEHWPLIPNFRPSASQALAKALKRGRLLKKGTLYSLNPEWTSGHTTPDPTQPARHITKRPASMLSPRPPPPKEYVAINDGDNTSTEASSSATQFPPETKAVAQAIISLLRPMARDIKDLANAQSRASTTDNTSDSAADSRSSGYSYDPSDNVIMTGFMDGSTVSKTPPSGFGEQRHMLPPAQHFSSQGDLGWSTPEVIPVDVSEASSRENEIRQSLLSSLEGISAQLHDKYGP